MDYNRIYKARYLYTVTGISSIPEIAEQTGLSLEMARKAVDDSMKDYPTIKADFKADLEAGDFSRTYEVPPAVTLKGATWEAKKERYFNMLCNGEKTVDGLKTLLIADNVKGTQIAKILNDLSERYEEYKAVDLRQVAERLIAVEQLPSKFTINKAMEVVEVFPSPMVDRETGHIYGVKYTSKPINWRAGLPEDLAIALYDVEHPLFIDGVEMSADPDRWGPAEYAVLIRPGKRKRGFYQELADYLGMEYEELKPYLTKARSYLARAEKESKKEAEAEPVDLKKVARIVAELIAEYKAKGGTNKKERKTVVADTAVTE